jgi:hypothetical protein
MFEITVSELSAAGCCNAYRDGPLHHLYGPLHHL